MTLAPRAAALSLLSFALLAACSCASGDAASMKASAPRESGGGPDRDPDRGGSDGGTSGFDGGAAVCSGLSGCPPGHTCENGVCKPPEEEKSRALSRRPPVASPHYVYALNPGADAVARIDPATLRIESIAVGPLPVDLVALPREDAAVVLSFNDASLSIVDSRTLPSRVLRVPLKRPYSRVAVSPDGVWAIAFSDPAKPPATGAEGIVTLVSLKGARDGKPIDSVRFERAAGFRVTDVVYRVEAGDATRAYVFAKQTVSIVDLKNPALNPLPARLDLPAAMAADIKSREVVADAMGTNIVLRSTSIPELAYFDGVSFATVPLPEVATDLDLFADGTAAVAALRASKKIAFIEIPKDLLDPKGIDILDTGGAAVGQVALPPSSPSSGSFAFVYTNASADESFARVDLPSGKVTKYTLQKLVDEIDISPDGKSAVVIHRPTPNPTASDEYEKEVDRDQGYSIFDVASGYAQLKRTAKVEPGPFAFSPIGGFLGVALKDDVTQKFALDAVNLGSLIASTVPLASAPLFMGPVPQAQGTSPHRIFVSQLHAAGRISVVSLDDRQIRTATGFTLNAEIE